uniref:Type III-B CRISPR module RAMP protein Cmr6 n=1 Tax=Dictyoglomus thermophilum TaxID=14 RepID=A0A7V3ZH63_DICTH
MNIKILQNDYFNKDIKSIFNIYLNQEITQNKFNDINFFYLFNMPSISKKGNKLEIKLNEYIDKFTWNSLFIENIKNRIERTISNLKNIGLYICSDITLKVSWRLIVGLGASHPQETSMTLHHIYGIPYIPGSAVKGVTRHWAVLKFADNIAREINESFEKVIERVSSALETDVDLNKEIDGITFKDLLEIFGTQEHEGKIIFFDAYPIENLKLKIDIMNPHYPDYYTGNEPPTDWQNPIPIKFLTVDSNTKFQFYLAGKNKELLDKTKSLLKEALINYGIGAKTSLGYGIFEE